MYDTNLFSNLFLIDITFTTTAVLLCTKTLEKAGILKITTSGSNSISSLLYGLAIATAFKSWNEYLRTDDTSDLANFINFSIDTIVTLPLTVNIWQADNKLLSHSAYLSVVLGFIPAYISEISSDAAKYLINQYGNDTISDYNTTYVYTTFKGVIPAFIRGITFFKFKQLTGNEPLSALLGGSIMSLMLDKSESYTAAGINIAICGLNTCANKIQYLTFNSFLDNIYPDSSTMIAIEFAEYFLRAAQIEKIIDQSLYSKATLNHELNTNLVPIFYQDNGSMNNDL